MARTGATHYHAQLGPADKGHASIKLVVCYAVWIGSMKLVFGQAQGALVWFIVVVRRAISNSSTATPHRFIQIHIIHTTV